MITDSKKIEILDKIHSKENIDNLDNIINELFNVIDSSCPDIDGKMFFIRDDDIVYIYKFSFNYQAQDFLDVYSQMKLKIDNFISLKKCIFDKEIVYINSENDNAEINWEDRLKMWMVNDIVYFPIYRDDEDVIGIIAFLQQEGHLKKDYFPKIKEIINFFYYFIRDAINNHKIELERKKLAIIKEKYNRLVALPVRINKLLDPEKLYKMLIKEFLDIFGFELGFVQIEKSNKLPIVEGAVSNENFKNILNDLTYFFGDINNAPKIKSETGPEMANCIAFLNNTYVYFEKMEGISELPMLEKDKKVFDMIGDILKSMIMLPISDKDKPIGVLQLWSFSKHISLNDYEIDIIKNLANFIPSVLKNSKLHSRVEEQSRLLKEKNEIIKSKTRQIRDELKIARNIQEKLIASAPDIDNVEISTLYKPMEEIGGDLYDFILFEEKNLLGVFISDVSGHGVPAALLTSMVKTLITTGGNYRFEPAKLLKYINEKILEQMNGNFLTAFYGVFDFDKNEVVYARAAHNYPLLLSGDDLIELKGNGKLLGVFPEIKIEENKINFKKDDLFVFYTDGLTEAVNNDNVDFESEFLKILKEMKNKKVNEILDKIYFSLINFKEDFQFEDDVCLICMKIK